MLTRRLNLVVSQNVRSTLVGFNYVECALPRSHPKQLTREAKRGETEKLRSGRDRDRTCDLTDVNRAL